MGKKGFNCGLCQVDSLPGALLSSPSHDACQYFNSWAISNTLHANLVILIMQLIPNYLAPPCEICFSKILGFFFPF